MKPTLQMEEGKPNVITITQAAPVAEETRKSPRQRWITGAVVVVVLVVVIAATAVTSVYLGNKMSQDNFKEAWVTYNNAKMNGSVTNKVVVTETEEDVTDPGKVRIIYDHEGRKMVVQYDEPLSEDDKVCHCYVVDWEVPEGGTTDAIKSEMTDSKMTHQVAFDERKHTLTPTEEEVDINSLSPRAREMCFGCNIVKTLDTVDEKEPEQKRKKRGCSLKWKCWISCGWRGCRWYCGLRWSCSWSWGR